MLRRLIQSLCPVRSIGSLLLKHVTILLTRVTSSLHCPTLCPRTPLIFSRLIAIVLRSQTFSTDCVSTHDLISVIGRVSSQTTRLRVRPNCYLLLFGTLSGDTVLTHRNIAILPASPGLISSSRPRGGRPLGQPLALRRRLTRTVVQLTIRFVARTRRHLHLTTLCTLSSTISMFHPKGTTRPLCPLIRLA